MVDVVDRVVDDDAGGEGDDVLRFHDGTIALKNDSVGKEVVEDARALEGLEGLVARAGEVCWVALVADGLVLEIE